MPRRTLALALLILLSGATIAVAAISENTGVAYGGTSSLTGPDGVCKMVTNNSATGKQVYVPGSTAAEWQSFVANPPQGVTLAACTMTCASGGVIVGGYCWYIGASAASCDTTCTSHGGTNLSGTRDYAGSGGTLAHCQAVINALDPAYSYAVSDNNLPGATAVGCGKTANVGGERRRYLPTTDASTGMAGWQRACACGSGTPTYLGWKTDTHVEDWLVTSPYSMNAWSNIGTIPANTAFPAIYVNASDIYAFGGFNGSALSGIYTASLSSPTSWSAAGSLPIALMGSQLVRVGSYVYLLGGATGNGSSGVSTIYRASADTPTSWTNVGSLPAARANAAAAIIGDSIYIFGGQTGAGSVTNSIYSAPLSSPTTWSSVGTLPFNMSNTQLAVIGDYVYMFGGYTGSYSNAIYRAPVSNPLSWTNVGSIPARIAYGTIAIVGSQVYIIGGLNNGTPTAAIYTASVANPLTWSVSSFSLPAPARSAQVAIAGGYIYSVGGYNNSSPYYRNYLFRAPLTVLP